MIRSGEGLGTASENFWRMPKEKSEDLRSKPHDFYQKIIARPQSQDAHHGSIIHFFYLLALRWTKGLQPRLPCLPGCNFFTQLYLSETTWVGKNDTNAVTKLSHITRMYNQTGLFIKKP